MDNCTQSVLRLRVNSMDKWLVGIEQRKLLTGDATVSSLYHFVKTIKDGMILIGLTR
jgi:hypothetical protein